MHSTKLDLVNTIRSEWVAKFEIVDWIWLPLVDLLQIIVLYIRY